MHSKTAEIFENLNYSHNISCEVSLPPAPEHNEPPVGKWASPPPRGTRNAIIVVVVIVVIVSPQDFKILHFKLLCIPKLLKFSKI